MKVEDKFNIKGIAEQMFQEMKDDGEAYDLVGISEMHDFKWHIALLNIQGM